MRADKAKNLGKVTKSILKDPFKTQREISEEVGIGLGSVNRNIQELEQNGTKDPRILAITDTDLNIVRLGQAEINRRMQDKEELEKMRTIEISQVIKENTARYTILAGNATDDKGGLRQPATINIVNPE